MLRLIKWCLTPFLPFLTLTLTVGIHESSAQQSLPSSCESVPFSDGRIDCSSGFLGPKLGPTWVYDPGPLAQPDDNMASGATVTQVAEKWLAQANAYYSGTSVRIELLFCNPGYVFVVGIAPNEGIAYSGCRVHYFVDGVLMGSKDLENITNTLACPAAWTVTQGASGYVCRSKPTLKQVCRSNPPAAPPSVGNPIDLFAGRKRQVEMDYANRDYSSLSVQRIYIDQASSAPSVNLGSNWKFAFDQALTTDTAKATVFAHRTDGSILVFKKSTNTYVADSDVNHKVSELPNQSGWALVNCADDSIETYDPLGRILLVTDRSGKYTSFERNSSGHLLSISDHFGRQVGFEYDADGKVMALNLPGSERIEYGYNSNGQLSSRKTPDQVTRFYLYDEPENFVPQPSGNQAARRRNLLTGIVDENGQRYATFKYNLYYGWPVESSHAAGVDRYQVSFPSSNDLTGYTTVTDPNGTTRQFYSQRILGSTVPVSSDKPCAGCSASITTDVNGNTKSRTDFRGNVTCYAYDIARNLETIRVEGIGTAACSTNLSTWTPAVSTPERKIVTTWHPTFRLPATVTETVMVGGTLSTKLTTNTYDTQGNLKQRDVTAPTGVGSATATRVWSWTYDDYGRVKTATDPLNRITTSTYYPNTAAQNTTLVNSRGMLATITNALGHVTTITAYNPHGQALSMTDANGLVTTMTYDGRQRLKTRTILNGGVNETTAYTYDAVGNLTRVITPDGSTVYYAYDGAHRMVGIGEEATGLVANGEYLQVTAANLAGNRIIYTLDNMGNRLREDIRDTTGALARVSKRELDALNRLKKTFSNATVSGTTVSFANETVNDYDSNGNLTKVTAPVSGTTTGITETIYDALNRVKEVRDAENGAAKPTKYEYDPQDNLTKVTDPNGLNTTYAYNGFNELITQVSPDTGTTTFTYDSAGNLKTKVDARNIKTEYIYDNLNRATRINYYNPSTATTAVDPVVYSYDAAASGTPVCLNGVGRLCTIVDKTGSTSYQYDTAGRVTLKSQTVSGVTQSVRYRYNAGGQLAEVTYPSGRRVGLRYANNRVVRVSVDGEVVVRSADYEPFGQIGEWRWGNDSVGVPNKHVRQFDLDGRVRRMETAAGVAPIQFGFDAGGRIDAIATMSLSNTSVVDTAKSFQYGYDKLDRLKGATPQAGNTSLARLYDYDATGNRIKHTLGSTDTAYVYPTTSHRLSQQTGGTAKTFGYDNVGNRLTDGSQTWTYGTDNRPTMINVGVTQLAAGINALGQRVLKNVTGAATGNGTTRFVYDEAGRLIGEYNLAGVPIQETVWLGDIPVAVLK
jgi:YD repeat-containing protein